MKGEMSEGRKAERVFSQRNKFAMGPPVVQRRPQLLIAESADKLSLAESAVLASTML